MANPAVWLPKFVILNYDVARDKHGRIICDENWRIEFHANMKPIEHVLLLFDLKLKRIEWGNPVYSAHVAGPDSRNLVVSSAPPPAKTLKQAVDDHEATQSHVLFNRHVLLFIHGFNSYPKSVFENCYHYHQVYPDRIVVPVLWAGGQAGIFSYLEDKHFFVPVAVRSFWRLLDYDNAFPERSLICHSMGNFLLQGLAKAYCQMNEKKKQPPKHCFDDIFMVAADVTVQLFDMSRNHDPIRSNNHGLCVVDLVRHSVHVLHSKIDIALIARVVPNFGQMALGLYGLNPATLHPQAKSKLVARNCNNVKAYGADWYHHCYFFEVQLMKYYENVMDKTKCTGWRTAN